MKCTVGIVCDNEAFHVWATSHEVARILHDLANEIYDTDFRKVSPRNLLDVNGNIVGYFDVDPN